MEWKGWEGEKERERERERIDVAKHTIQREWQGEIDHHSDY